MLILIEAAKGGGYQLHFKDGEDIRFTKPKKAKYLYEVMDTSLFLMNHLEHQEGIHCGWVITPEALQQNRDNDLKLWRLLSDPNFRPSLPRLIRDWREIQE